MKVLSVFVFLLLSGCAAGFTSVNTAESLQTSDTVKYASLVQFERLGALTSNDISTRRQCGSRQVRVCSTSDANASCQCMAVNDAETRLRQMVRQHRGHGSH